MPLLPQVAMSFVRILYEFWLQQGVSKTILDDVLRVDIADQNSAKFGISSNRLTALHKAANSAVKDRVLAVRLGQHIAEKDLALERLIIYSDNLYHGLSVLIDHSKVVSESGYFSFLAQSNGRYALKFHAHDKIHFSSQQRDMVFSAILAAIEKLSPRITESIYYYYDQRVAGFDDYSAVLNCHLMAANDVYIEIDAAPLIADNGEKNPKLFEKTVYQINKVLLRREQHLALYKQVTDTLHECLLAGNAHQEVVAEKLNTSVRNLQRRLKEVGTNYQAILDDCREALALKLISDHELALYEVAYKVGFNEPSAFYKAFRRWTGKRPGDYRQDVIHSEKDCIIETQVSEVSNVDG